ncbi:heat shock 70 kDa protein 12B-like [Mya arenaria]|uniref:heat shock 70 kDa protein 12B-like n=1 Tax=Mya arenaria TaxID=6604 RepID=UPI0022E8ECBD|nr:heat shock 70 kDa protein 12B-like [Mya arenaria]
MEAKTKPHLLVTAFDFGTTYSGYAFSFQDDRLKVQTNQTWYSGGTGKMISLKTSVLLNPEGELDSFGFEAEDNYASKTEDDEHEGWRLFRRFKMVLHNNKAGLDENRITLALKPESASNWCETLDVDTKAALAGTGTQYMVIDLGGGTADISIHKKSQGGTLKGIHQPTGGPWGGIYIDVSNIKFLELVFGEKAITALKTEEIADYFDVIREFETKKRTF